MSDEDTNNETPRNGDNDPDLAQVQDGESDANRRINRNGKKGLLSFRNIALLTILTASGAVGYEIWKNPDLIAPSKLSQTPNVDDTPAGDQLRTSERYQDNLRRQNEAGAREARETDTSFIATPDEPLRQIDDKPPAIAPNRNRPLPPANVRVETQEPRTVVIDRQQPALPTRTSEQQPAAPDYSRINQLAQLMATQQQGLLGAWQVQPSTVTVVVEQDLVPKEETAANIGAGPGNTLGRTSPALSKLLIRAGDVVLAKGSLSMKLGAVVDAIRKMGHRNGQS